MWVKQIYNLFHPHFYFYSFSLLRLHSAHETENPSNDIPAKINRAFSLLNNKNIKEIIIPIKYTIRTTFFILFLNFSPNGAFGCSIGENFKKGYIQINAVPSITSDGRYTAPKTAIKYPPVVNTQHLR